MADAEKIEDITFSKIISMLQNVLNRKWKPMQFRLKAADLLQSNKSEQRFGFYVSFMAELVPCLERLDKYPKNKEIFNDNISALMTIARKWVDDYPKKIERYSAT